VLTPVTSRYARLSCVPCRLLSPGTPDIRSPWRYLGWLIRQQRGRVALGVLWGCIWMLSQALVPAVIGTSIDALIRRDTGTPRAAGESGQPEPALHPGCG
jgi:hypothetical protein